MKTALITGITGQDGFFLAKYLLKKNYLDGVEHVFYGDISNKEDITTTLTEVMPNEIYNLASQSSPGQSWFNAPQTLNVNGMGALHLFEAARTICPKTKIYQASSSEMFGQAKTSLQNEETELNPANPYAASKALAHHLVGIYRKSYGLFISSGILFNHESERRPLHFVTQKIAYGAACAALGILNSPHNNERGIPIVAQGKLGLGNFEVARDWGYAPDFVRAMWLMLQHDTADDFVIGTGKLHTLRELCEVTYKYVNKDWKEHVISDPELVRPLETIQTVADISKAQRILKWAPSIGFHEMIKKLVDAQINRLSNNI
jgi:GDPmannose 4,6-dehydratase